MQIISNIKETELEKKFSAMRASFTKKFFVTFLDLLYVIIFNLPIFIFSAYWKPEQGVIMAFKSLVKKDQEIESWRLLCFALWIFFFCYIYFVLIPSFTNYQTLFSNNLGLRAINLSDDLNNTKKIKQRQLFMANFVPIFLLLIFNIIFFLTVSIFHPKDWNKVLFESVSVGSKYLKIFFRSLFMFMVYMQIFHLFTVSSSRKTLNWFVRSNGIVYVDSNKFDLVMMSELKPEPIKNKVYVDMPGVDIMSYETVSESQDSIYDDNA